MIVKSRAETITPSTNGEKINWYFDKKVISLTKNAPQKTITA